MSRIIVKGLAKGTGEKELRELFSRKGEVTDVKLVRTKAGKSRQFAFVGFRSEVQATEAQSYFNNTFLDTARITVESAKRVGDETLTASTSVVRSRHTLKKIEKLNKEKDKDSSSSSSSSSSKKAVVDEKKLAAAAKTGGKAPISQEKSDFLEAMKPRRATKFWANDESLATGFQGEGIAPDSYPKGDDDDDDDDGDDDDDDVNDFTGLGTKKSKKKAGVADDSEEEEEEEEEEEKEEEHVSAASKKKNAKNAKEEAKAVSDLDFLRSKVSKNFSDDDDSSNESDQEQEEEEVEDEDEEDDEEEEERGADSDDDESDDGLHKGRASSSSSSSSSSRKKASAASSKGNDDVEESKKKGKKRGRMEEEEEEEDDDDDDEEEAEAKARGKANNGKDEEEDDDDDDTGRLFVRNLPFTCSEEELTALFSPFGTITEVHLPISKEKAGKGFGFVQFLIPEHAVKARVAIDGTSFQGRVLHVLPSKKPRDSALAAGGAGGEGGEEGKAGGGRLSAYQQKKELERRNLAGKKDGWSASFVRSDAVVDSLAQKYGVSTSDILDTQEAGGEMAVRLAIGEAHVVQENRDFFASHGVDIAALESHLSNNRASARSNTTMLIKNLPHDLVEDELENMFAGYGSLASFLVPQSKTVALVDFIEPTEARAAFKGLAYRRYKHTPLYLEWAPTGVIDKQKQQQQQEKKKKKESIGATASKKAMLEGADGLEGDSDEYSTLFVKNLNFSSNETALQQHILSLGVAGLRAVSIPKKMRGTEALPMGFGFAEFIGHVQAQEAMKRLQGTVLDGHSLDIKPSDKRISAASSSSNNKSKSKKQKADQQQTSTKLIVRNVAFQATQAELKSLFSAFGSVKRVRIPKKMGGVHRGFAFIDFSTTQEAASAMASLTNSHLYGRHLVLEWAKDEDDDLDVLRKRSSLDEGAIRAEKKKRRLDEADLEGGGDEDD